MKKIVIALLAVIMLIGAGLYFRQNSSYYQYKKDFDEHTDKDKASLSSDGTQSGKDEPYAPTPEDLSIDKTLKEGRARNEKLWREMGASTTIFPVASYSVDRPSFSEAEYEKIYDALGKYMSLYPEQFYESNNDESESGQGMDPRIDDLVYGDESRHDRGILKGYSNENLVVTDVKKRDGEYTTIITGRTSEEEDWEVLAEGNYYELRGILLDQ